MKEKFEIKLKDFIKKSKELEKEGKKLKTDFKKIIKDKKIPFKERLTFFKDSPDSCKEHDSWLPQARREGPVAELWERFTDGEGEDGYRGHVVDICDRLADQIYAYLEEEPDFSGYGIFETKEEFEKFFEDIFKRNLGSFIFDW